MNEMCSDCDYVVETDKAATRARITESLEELEGGMKTLTRLMALQIRLALNPPETENDRRHFSEKLDDISDRGYWFD